VSYDMINNKNATVIKFRTCIINVGDFVSCK
jgi:hypothetical protein